MVLAIHLWVQKARGFDQGCLGLQKPVMVVDSGCREVSELPSSHLLGVSNAAWGFAFYTGIALLSLARLAASPSWFGRLNWVTVGCTGAGVLYSGYLVVAMLQSAAGVCLLCLCSAVLVTILFVLAVVLWRRERGQPLADAERLRELCFALLGIFFAGATLVGVLVFVNRLGTRPLDQGSSAHELQSIVGRALPLFIDEQRLREMQACRFDPWLEPLDLDKLVPRKLPSLGRQDGLTMAIFYDPSCPHCADHYPQMRALAERQKERLRMVIIPRLIFDRSLVPIAALRLAEPSGKYYELWDRLLASPAADDAGAPGVPQIAEHFRALGLDVTALEKRLADAQAEVLAETRRLSSAGISGTPTVLIGGHRVLSGSLSPSCLERLIAQTPGTPRPRKAFPRAVSP